jgi:hypothetical protein
LAKKASAWGLFYWGIYGRTNIIFILDSFGGHMGRITSYSKQIVVFFLALSLFIRPTFASSVGGWSMGNPIAQGASTIYEGSKNVIINGADYVKKGAATITPTAANVAKTLGKGVGGLALSVAVDQLLDGVDWVLDPANNQIVYNKPLDPTDPSVQFIWSYNGAKFATPQGACQAYLDSFSGSSKNYVKGGVYISSNTFECLIAIHQVSTGQYLRDDKFRVTGGYNPAYDPKAESEDQKKTLPLANVAAQVITNAESETDTKKKAAAQVATAAAAADIVAEAETDSVKARPIAQQLEASSTTKPADPDVADKADEAQGTAKPNKTNPQATDLSLEFPAFCGWAPTVCEFTQTAIQSIADAKAEYADKPQENTDTELEIPDPEEQSIDSDISFGGSCPAPLTSQVNFMGINETIEFSFDPLCEIAQFIKPVVISVSAFSAALIVAGIRTEDD